MAEKIVVALGGNALQSGKAVTYRRSSISSCKRNL